MQNILIKDYLLSKGIDVVNDIIFIAKLNNYEVTQKDLLKYRKFNQFSECDVKLDNLGNVIHKYGKEQIFITEKPDGYDWNDKLVKQKSISDHPTLIKCCFKYLFWHFQKETAHKSFMDLLKLGSEMQLMTANKKIDENQFHILKLNKEPLFDNFIKSIRINEKGLGFYYKPKQEKKVFYSLRLNEVSELRLFNSEYMANKLFKGFLVWFKHGGVTYDE